MPVFETPNGTRKALNLPNVEWSDLQKVVDSYRQQKADLKATHTRAGSLRNEKQKVEQAAVVALKDAIKEGKGEEAAVEKHDKQLAKIEKQIAACERRSVAIEQALDETEAELILVVDDNRQEWLEELAGEVESVLSEYADAVETLASKRQALSRFYALRRWVTQFPEESDSFAIGRGVLPSLKSFHGSPYFVDDVLAALREDAHPDPHVAVARPFSPLLAYPGAHVIDRDTGAIVVAPVVAPVVDSNGS